MGAEIRRLLIANRGEIAVRVIRACRELGISPLAVHEPGEAAAAHVRVAERAFPVGSYLDGEALVAAALAGEADAVHPGYGFLAEDADFADAVLRAGMVWVGPSPAAMRAVGDKVEARRLAQAAGVPVVPGYSGVDLSDQALRSEAARLGFPLLVKAAAGGGGRGMRLVRDAGELDESLAAARRESQAAFGRDRIFLERAVPGARHVEVQILADLHGNAVHLGERDCSVQRRHQKIVEESPSPAVDPDLRASLGDAALRMAAAAGYTGAGTVEFLLAEEGAWYFLELNARLQVEHPVTEAVCGIDLVRAQIEIAAGRPLELAQPDVSLRGHAIECRLYAEDPAAGFLPAAGRLLRFRPPLWPGVRVDTAASEGDEVGTAYDPLLAKVIAQAEDRDACAERMSAALAELVVVGVTTNLGFLRWVIDHPEFRAGRATTGFVAEHWRPDLVPELPAGVRPQDDPTSPWVTFGTAGQPAGVVVVGRHALHLGWAHRLSDDAAGHLTVAGEGSLQAPMPGTVLQVEVEPGDPVTTGQRLMLLEAMKMELAVSSPGDGVVTAVHVRPGELVRAGQTLLELEA